MDIEIIIFTLSIFSIELILFYTPLYYITYEGFNLDQKIGDNKLSIIITITSIVISILFYPAVSSLAINLLF